MALLGLALIDFDRLLLPDQVTLPLLWAGLAAAIIFESRPAPADALIGAIAGYALLWLFYRGRRRLDDMDG